MQQFELDESTFHDLEIDNGSYDTSPSIFRIFSVTQTQGGKEFLHKLIRNPVSDDAELSKRVNLIRSLQANTMQLRFNSRMLNYVESYLSLNVLVLKNNPLDALLHRINEWRKPSNEYYLIKMGCISILSLLYEIDSSSFFTSLPALLKPHVSAIQSLHNRLKSMILPHQKLSRKQIIYFDRLFRLELKDVIQAMLQEIYFVDAYQTVARVGNEKSFCLPTYSDRNSIPLKFTAIFHPFIDDPVTNDFEFESNENMCFLTGPNMAGKSTFLKAVGICVYLAHLGFPVPAKEFQTTVYSGMITTINLVDDLQYGHSHFYSEVYRVKQAAKSLAHNKRMFVLFDELFRGTNVKDALDASTEIMKRFALISHCTFFMSTHIVEIADELRDLQGISYRYFESNIIDDSFTYSYKLKKGISAERLGMHIIKNEGIFELLDSIKSS